MAMHCIFSLAGPLSFHFSCLLLLLLAMPAPPLGTAPLSPSSRRNKKKRPLQFFSINRHIISSHYFDSHSTISSKYPDRMTKSFCDITEKEEKSGILFNLGVDFWRRDTSYGSRTKSLWPPCQCLEREGSNPHRKLLFFQRRIQLLLLRLSRNYQND